MAIYKPIDNQDGRRRYELFSPINMQSLGILECATNEDIQVAINKSKKAQEGWKKISVLDRSNFIHKMIDHGPESPKFWLLIIMSDFLLTLHVVTAPDGACLAQLPGHRWRLRNRRK